MNRTMKLAAGLVVAIALGMSSQSNGAAIAYLSEVGTVGGGATLGNPVLDPGAQSLYVWLTTDGNQGLLFVDLNVVSSGPGAVFTGVQVYNPNIVFAGFGNADVSDRWQSTALGTNNGSSINSFRGFKVSTGDGIDPVNNKGNVGPANRYDQLYDPANNSWLFARIDLNVTAEANIFLQIGEGGISPLSGTSANVNVVFGAGGDPQLNAANQRGISSATPDATAIPEPSTVVLGSLGLVGAAVMMYRRRRAA
jgi:hypothetical protein